MREHYLAYRGESFRGHKPNFYEDTHVMGVSFHGSPGTSFLEEKTLNREFWISGQFCTARGRCAQPGPDVHSVDGACIFVS